MSLVTTPHMHSLIQPLSSMKDSFLYVLYSVHVPSLPLKKSSSKAGTFVRRRPFPPPPPRPVSRQIEGRPSLGIIPFCEKRGKGANIHDYTGDLSYIFLNLSIQPYLLPPLTLSSSYILFPPTSPFHTFPSTYSFFFFYPFSSLFSLSSPS
jgi:hypothetical protein